MRVNHGGFGDEQSTRSASPLNVVFETKVAMDVLFVGPKPRHRTENNTILKVHTTNADRLEEFRHCGHFEDSRCKRVVSEKSLKEAVGSL